MLPRANNIQPHLHAGAVFNYTTQKRREPEDEQHRAGGLAPSASDSFYFTFKDLYSEHAAVIPAGPAKWGFFNTHYLNTDRGIQRELHEILRSNSSIDTDFGRASRRSVLPPDGADWTRIDRNTVGFNLGQFHPELNPRTSCPS